MIKINFGRMSFGGPFPAGVPTHVRRLPCLLVKSAQPKRIASYRNTIAASSQQELQFTDGFAIAQPGRCGG